MTLTAKDVAEIMRVLEESSFDSLSLEMNGVKLHLQRRSPLPAGQSSDPGPSSSTSSSALGRTSPKIKPPSEPGLLEIPAPLLGIYYRAPKPAEPPFVEVGSKVKEDTVIGIIEVMKLMNSVHAGVKGEVVEILVQNSAAVEYGEILMRVRPEA